MSGRVEFIFGEEWEHVGNQYVDSGTVIISDPCYVLPDTMESKAVKSYDTFLEDVNPDGSCKNVLQPWGDGHATILSTTEGDGSFPVYIQRDHYGRPTHILIDVCGDLIEE